MHIRIAGSRLVQARNDIWSKYPNGYLLSDDGFAIASELILK